MLVRYRAPSEPARSPSPSQTPATTQPPPSSTTPQATPPATPAPSVAAPAAGPQTTQPPGQATGPLALEQVLGLAAAQVSALQQAQLNERIASEDVRQARAAFLPKITSPLDYVYTSPAVGLQPGEPRTQSFIANNAIGEYQALLSVAGDVDLSGRLRATLARANALLDAARAGTEVARRTLEICRRHGILFVADEVQTGFGRTGSLFAGRRLRCPLNAVRSML